MARSLPEVVRNYAERAVGESSPSAGRVRVSQTGRMQQKPDGRWLRFTAIEDFEVDHVGFVWRAKFPIVPLVSLLIVDELDDDDGELIGRLWGRLRVLSATGTEVMEAQAQRYLSELVWCPQAILINQRLMWTSINDRRVAVSTTVGGRRVSVDLGFDEAGDVVAASTDARYRTIGTEQIHTPWSGSFSDYERIGGLRIPTRAQVGWDLGA